MAAEGVALEDFQSGIRRNVQRRSQRSLFEDNDPVRMLTYVAADIWAAKRDREDDEAREQLKKRKQVREQRKRNEWLARPFAERLEGLIRGALARSGYERVTIDDVRNDLMEHHQDSLQTMDEEPLWGFVERAADFQKYLKS